jgi:hypothetical protein
MLLGQLGFTQKEPTLILEDNEGCIFAIKNDKNSAKLKHIDIKYHFCKERVASNEVKFHSCDTTNMIADLLTKPLPKDTFEKLRD